VGAAPPARVDEGPCGEGRPVSAVRTRPAAVAGSFYPGRADELARAVDAHVEAGRRAAGGPGAPASASALAPAGPPAAVVVPHAGYVYSGRVAGAVYARLAPWRDVIHRVVVIGPAHRARVRGLATVGVDAVQTPLGTLPVDTDLRDRALAHPVVHVDDHAHAEEHALEVQFPFLQRVLGEVSVLPLVAGLVDPEDVADVLADAWGEPGVLVVVSTDLSHYHDARTADRLDARTAAAVVAGDVDAIGWDDACGATPLRGALVLAARRGQHASLVDRCTSADTAGPPDRVVGYGGFEIR